MSDYVFDQSAKVNLWEVRISAEDKYGFFEHDKYGEGGGLWFESVDGSPGTLSLVDYDGRAVLPKDVAAAIRQLGHVVSEDFD